MSLNLGSLKMGGLDEELADSIGLYSVLDLKIDVSKLAEGHAISAEVSNQTVGGMTTKGEQSTASKTGSDPTINSESRAPGIAASSSSQIPLTDSD